MPSPINRPVPPFAFAVLLAAPLLLSPPAAVALPAPRPAERPQNPSSTAAKAEVVKIAVTPEDHLAKAEEYKKKAATYREEAAFHRKMLDDYKKTVASGPIGKVPENPYIAKMRKHCEGYIKDAEALAAEAERFAEFHRMRAAELRGE
jgi:hypothetical protein